MTSDTRKARFDRYFDLLDRDNDGLLEREDFEAVADRLAAARGYDQGSDGHRQINQAWLKTYDHVMQFADSNRDGKATKDEWAATLESTAGDEQQMREYVDTVTAGIFDLLDSDNSGTVSLEEYATFIEAFGGTRSDAEQAFPKLDTNGDGKLSRDEVIALARQFHTSQDSAAPGASLFGPI